MKHYAITTRKWQIHMGALLNNWYPLTTQMTIQKFP